MLSNYFSLNVLFYLYGMFSGHYMYIETSSPRVAGNKAWLLSQTFNPTTTTTCVSFWYHMYGQTIGMI